MRSLVSGVLGAAALAFSAAAQDGAARSFDEAIDGLEHRAGFFDLYVDPDAAKVLAALPAPGEDGVSVRFIYTPGLTAGLGSNPVGLDRGVLGGSQVLAARKIGPRLVLEAENLGYRATADRPLEKAAVEKSFARSFIWSTEITASADDGRLLVDLTDFLTRDALGVTNWLKGADQGSFSVAADESLVDPSQTLVFPDNVEIDAYLTLSSSEPGSEVRRTAAVGGRPTFIQHHSFVRLPDDGYATRKFDPRSGAFSSDYYDFSAPLEDPIVRGDSIRFRLQKAEPGAAPSEPVEPLVFYVDPGAPELVRDALIEGASWWAEAFEAAGFEDAFRVELLPEGAHPLDVRYNVIQWVHRQTRGWSYGGGVYDPRTGERLKANVILGSQRVRQDIMILRGLAGANAVGGGGPDDPLEIALARIRQLSAHEVGHTLGLAHNFIASADGRASVMDYPAPWIRPDGAGGLSFEDAYDVGIGEWDKHAIRWLYADFDEGADVDAELDALIAATRAEGYRFIGDSDSRSYASGHPFAALWDNGSDPVAELDSVMAVRRIALAKFGAGVLPDGVGVSTLSEALVPIYLFHRYQLEAAAHSLGGVDFSYGVNGDGAPTAETVDPETQRAALSALLAALEPAELDLSDELLASLTPSPAIALVGGEDFNRATGPAFDLQGAAAVAADAVLTQILQPARAARLVEQHAVDPDYPGIAEVVATVEAAVFDAPRDESLRHAELRRTVQTRVVAHLVGLSSNGSATPAVRAGADAALRGLEERLDKRRRGATPEQKAHDAWLAGRIAAHLKRPAEAEAPAARAPEAPPGSPIGVREDCWHCSPPSRGPDL